MKKPPVVKKPFKPKVLGQGAEGTVKQISPRRAVKEVYVTDNWAELNKNVIPILEGMAKSRRKTKYLCPLYGFEYVPNQRPGSYRPHLVRYKMAACKPVPRKFETNWGRDWDGIHPFRKAVNKECKKLGLPRVTDWHKWNVMWLNNRPVRIDYFPWYSQPWGLH